jgi:hypothetical protein
MCIIIFYIIYAGRYAEGRSCRGMDHYSNREKQPVGVAGSDSSLNFISEEGGSKDETNWFGTDAFSQFSDQANDSAFLEALEGEKEQSFVDQTAFDSEQVPELPCINSRPSISTPQVPDKRRAKRPKPDTTSSNDFHERYLRLKKEEIDRFTAIEEKKMEDPYSIKNCVSTLEGMAEELLMEEMIKAADIFKDNPPAREVFLSFTSDQFRLGWLRKQL